MRARHGPGPWPHYGDPLPDALPDPSRIRLIGGGADGLCLPEGTESSIPSAAALADRIQRITATRLDHEAVAEFHDALTHWRALAFADDLSTELRRRALPRTGLRVLGRRLAAHGTHRNPVKIGLLLLGLGGDHRDRELLLLLGTLDELTLFAAVALLRSQPDPDTAVHTLAQRVAGWGRINAVRRLQGTDDPVIRAWLLREGFRNTVMNVYLAPLAATTGRLHEALAASSVDQQLLDGAGSILAALADMPSSDVGPGLAEYPHSVPVLRRYADLVDTAAPTVDCLENLLTIAGFLRRASEDLAWSPADLQQLTGRYQALLNDPRWPGLLRAHLADPHRPDFHAALGPASALGIDPMPEALARLDSAPPLTDYTWYWALRHTDDRDQAEHIATLAALQLTESLPTAPRPGNSGHILRILASVLGRHPGVGWPILHAALLSSDADTRGASLRTLAAWPSEELPAEAIAYLGRC
ncbi:hypothetical protein ACEZCY_28640 [Streptacidiphilus sp. N1-12]|uniref:Uncharacterized protein n=2 Tax=Streptacidiphilus alkalitolerans TaxID=3342712 RepID=A0ABV6WMA4_9ACTN